MFYSAFKVCVLVFLNESTVLRIKIREAGARVKKEKRPALASPKLNPNPRGIMSKILSEILLFTLVTISTIEFAQSDNESGIKLHKLEVYFKHERLMKDVTIGS